MDGIISEDEVLQFFVSNGGIVRNNEIVTYFRHYLANPAIKGEARSLFKVIVNKLATVKVENGEKFLILKRQYFLPIDGNGNASLAVTPSSTLLQQQRQLYPSSPPSFQFEATGRSSAELSQSTQSLEQRNAGIRNSDLIGSPPTNFIPYQYQVPPLYVSSNVGATLPSSQQLINQTYQSYQQQTQSQSPLYGSQFSLNSNYNPGFMDSYFHSPQSPPSQLSSQKLPPAPAFNDLDYGLPPPPKQSQPPRRLSFTSPSVSSSSLAVSSGGNGFSSGSPGRLIPPPYRPPPPAPGGSSPTTPPLPFHPIRPTALTFISPQSNMEPMANLEISHCGVKANGKSPRPIFQRTQSESVSSGLIGGLLLNSSGNKETNSASPSRDNGPFFSNTSATAINTSPAPPVPPRAKRSSSFLEKSPLGSSASASSSSTASTLAAEDQSTSATTSEENDKENDFTTASALVPESTKFGDTDPKISVKERMQKFNKVQSEDGLGGTRISNGTSRGKRESKPDSGEYDTSSLSSYSYSYAPEPKAREWILKAAKCDYAGLNKMAQEMPGLVGRRDINGYTALHWASKQGHTDLVKLLAGTFKSDVNTKSNGGYTPLHLAAQFSRQEVYDVLVQVYNADANVRDHSGKKPMQYLIRQDTSVSLDTVKSEFSLKKASPRPFTLTRGRKFAYESFIRATNTAKKYRYFPKIPGDSSARDINSSQPHGEDKPNLSKVDNSISLTPRLRSSEEIKEKRRSTEHGSHRESLIANSFLRIGSLNVRVKKTTEAFGNFLGKSHSVSQIVHKKWGSSNSLSDDMDKDKEMMPPPSATSILRSSSTGTGTGAGSKSKRGKSRKQLPPPSSPSQQHRASAVLNSETTTIVEGGGGSGSESDGACGFGTEWK